jgi:hypothetical protein
MLAEISFYNLVLFVHIAAVVPAFGILAINVLVLTALFLMVTKPGA